MTTRGGTPATPACALDRDILNAATVGRMDDLGLSVFAKLCGANRGAFVLDPPDGHTYGCTTFPASFAADAGLPPGAVPDSANLTQTFAAGGLPAAAAVDVVDRYVRAVYATSADAAADPFACDVNGLAALGGCAAGSAPRSLRPDDAGVRAATLAGALVPAPWATGGKALAPAAAEYFYAPRDFRDMAALGVNTVQLPVPCGAFREGGAVAKTAAKLLERADRAGLSAILVLVAEGKEEASDEVVDEQVTAAAAFAAAASNVIALQLPAPRAGLLSAVRSAAETLAVLVPTTRGELRALSFPPDGHLFAALDAGATDSVEGVASSDSVGDRMKMFYHESISCIDRSPIEWSACYRDMPVYVTSGFDLAVDDCVHRNEKTFKDYGQCERFDETMASDWWMRHRRSLMARQLFAYSRGLGWTYSAWKVHGEAEMSAALSDPSQLRSLRAVAAAGLLPPLDAPANATASGAACLNGPAADFIMGDATFAPTPTPHECGNGWWNGTTDQCDYWVPPPPPPAPTDYPTLLKGAAAGAVTALVATWAVKKITSRNGGYQTLP